MGSLGAKCQDSEEEEGLLDWERGNLVIGGEKDTNWCKAYKEK